MTRTRGTCVFIRKMYARVVCMYTQTRLRLKKNNKSDVIIVVSAVEEAAAVADRFSGRVAVSRPSYPSPTAATPPPAQSRRRRRRPIHRRYCTAAAPAAAAAASRRRRQRRHRREFSVHVYLRVYHDRRNGNVAPVTPRGTHTHVISQQPMKVRCACRTHAEERRTDGKNTERPVWKKLQ